ncbi:MAG: rRNA maturation RNase YbeY [Bacteroidetes bacterium]|nr:rRNA maturation RNase YbeY [Bacteroidota bacterium]
MILLSTNHPQLRFPGGDVIRALNAVYKGEGKELSSLAVVFTYDRFIKKINREFLKHDYSTDVIAFPLDEEGGVEGEIYINLDAARRQALEYGVTYTGEVRRLLIHGVLHLLGYSDASARKKEMMRKREDMYLEKMKVKKRK